MKPYAVWIIGRTRDQNRLQFFDSMAARDAFVNVDRRRRIPLESCGSLPACRVPEPTPPKVAWWTRETPGGRP
jgi:hypothetical protein